MDYYLPRPKRVFLSLILFLLIFAVFLNVVIFPSFLALNEPIEDSTRNECNITDSLALNALERMTTEKCKSEAKKLFCSLQEGEVIQPTVENRCPAFNQSVKGAYEGCFSDRISNRLLRSHMYDLKGVNSPELCTDYCLRAGFEFAGVEFGHECFCGTSKDFNKRQPIPQERCERYKCSNGDSCGGYEAIAVHRTGVTGNVTSRLPRYVEPSEEREEVRILFVIQLNGRDVRQFHRMLKTVYSPSHFYYVHIDVRQNFLFQEIVKLEKLIPNLRVTRNRRATIWGGASLLPMFLDSIREAKSFGWTEWDFVLNMSESDMMILTLDELEANLASNKGSSYLSSHGYNAATFIRKQGFNFVFFECEHRMWRIGNRTHFPSNTRLDGGSDWVIIGRDLAEIALEANDSFVSGLLKFFETVLLPLESFFHTLAMNTNFCHSVVRKNLRLTNWNRTQGCRFDRIKKVVDWGGCSPLVFRESKIASFRLEQAKDRALYFARKFDSMIDVNPIAAAERQSLRNRLYLIDDQHPSFDSSWVNFYSVTADGVSRRHSIYRDLASQFLQNPLENMFAYKSASNSSVQLILSSSADEVLVSRNEERSEIREFLVEDKFQLVDASVGLDLHLTEEVFKDYSALPDTNSTITLLLRWSGAAEGNKTSPQVNVRWYPPTGTTIINQKVVPYTSIYYSQYVNLDLSKYGGESGEWKVSVFAGDSKTDPLVTLRFPVVRVGAVDDDLLRKFYAVQDTCAAEDCGGKTWSSRSADPKSRITRGYDSATGWLFRDLQTSFMKKIFQFSFTLPRRYGLQTAVKRDNQFASVCNLSNMSDTSRISSASRSRLDLSTLDLSSSATHQHRIQRERTNESLASRFVINLDNVQVPRFLVSAFEFLEKNEYEKVEGVFRIEGSSRRISSVMSQILDRGGSFDGVADPITVHDVCSMVKKYLRKLDLLHEFSVPTTTGGSDLKMKTLKALRSLSHEKRRTLAYIMRKLYKLQLTKDNQMTPYTLALVFAPCLFATTTIPISLVEARRSMDHQARVVEVLIENHDAIGNGRGKIGKKENALSRKLSTDDFEPKRKISGGGRMAEVAARVQSLVRRASKNPRISTRRDKKQKPEEYQFVAPCILNQYIKHA